MIVEEQINSLDTINLKFKKNKYPQCSDPNLPRLYFVSLFCGSRGSGKTYSCCQLLKQYEKYGLFQNNIKIDQRVILIRLQLIQYIRL